RRNTTRIPCIGTAWILSLSILLLFPQKQKAESLSVCRKLCFAMGGAPYQMTGNAIGFFLQIFLLDVVQMEAFYASLILFTGRVWDAFTDPIVGFLVSKSRRTRFGKLLPWIIFSMPCGVAAYFLLWFSPSYTMSSAYSFIWYLVTYCAFHTCMSCFHVPYSALTMFLGGDQKDRDSATAFRKHHFPTIKCRFSLFLEIISPCSDIRAYILAAAVIGGLYFICSMILFLGVKELAGSLASKNQVAVSYLTGLKLVMNHKPYVSLTFGFLFISLAFQLVQGNFALFCTHAAGLGHHFQHIVLIILVSAALTVPFWQWVLMKFGKKTALFVGLIVSYVYLNLSLITVMAVPAGASLAVAFLLPWSMLPDVVDDFRAKHPHCLDLEALFYSFYVFFTKFAAGASLGFSTLCLHFSGYRAGTCSHSPTVAITLRVLIAPIPITLLLIGLVIFYFYPINETRRKQLKVELEAVM
uniref:Major facilitator superfamily domain containing 2a-like 2 n=1 Tax=Callorhinchus milii TaxID=7868 RepID=A0A4W3GM93_CALMI